MKRHPSILIVAWLLVTLLIMFGNGESVRLRLWELFLLIVSSTFYVCFPSKA